MREMLAERPVLVEQRHADRGIGIQHLLGGDDLDLVGIDVEPEFGSARSPRRRRGCAAASGNPNPLPRTGARRSSRHGAAFSCFPRRLKQIVEHRKDFAAVADLAHRQRRAARRARSLIQRTTATNPTCRTCCRRSRRLRDRRRYWQTGRIISVSNRPRDLAVASWNCRRRRPARRRCSSPPGETRERTISCIACSALETSVPPDAGPWKKVSSSTSSARSVWRMNTISTCSIAPLQEHVEQHVEPLGEVLHVLGHRARDVHQAEHHRLRHRLRHGLEPPVADVDRIDERDPANFGLQRVDLAPAARRGAPRRSPRARASSSAISLRPRPPQRHPARHRQFRTVRLTRDIGGRAEVA